MGNIHSVTKSLESLGEEIILIKNFNDSKLCKNPNVASQYGIRSIPTLMIFKGGQKVDTVVGAVPKATLSSTLTKHL